MTTLGEAFIEVHADTKPFARELNAELKRILKETDARLQPETVRLGQDMAKGIADGIDKDSNRIHQAARRVGNKLGDEAKTWADKLEEPFKKMAKGNFILTRLFGQTTVAAIQLTRRIGRLTGSFIKYTSAVAELGAVAGQFAVKGLGALFGAATNLAEAGTAVTAAWAKVGSSFAAFGAQLLAFAPTALAIAGSIFLLVGAFTALAGILVVIAAPFATLLNLALVLPAAITALLVVILPLVLAFKGLGDALKVAFEKDPKKFAAGLKALPPVMREIVAAIRPFRSRFLQLRDTVQQAFFEPILKRLGPALDQVLSTLLVGLSAIASSLGAAVSSILQLFANPEFNGKLTEFMLQFADFIRENAGTFAKVLDALTTLALAALPVLEELLSKFGDFFIKFSEWINGAITDGRFEKWLQTGKDDLKSIWNLIVAIINLFKEMFTQTDEGGRKFLDKITATLNKITAWMKSPEGKQAMKDLVNLANQFADALEVALKVVKFILGTYLAIADAIKWIRAHPIPKGVITGAGGPLGDLLGFSGGGVVPRDQIAMVHKGEPILDPANSVAKNRSIIADAGMTDVLGESETVVNVYLGTERLDERIDFRVGATNRRNARSLTTGPRS